MRSNGRAETRRAWEIVKKEAERSDCADECDTRSERPDDRWIDALAIV